MLKRPSLPRMRRPASISEYPPSDPLEGAPLGGSKSEAMYRLQLGIAGVVGILMLVGLASIIENRAKQVEAASVPEAAATVEPSPTPTKPDPLAEAGVVPNLPASPTPTDGAPASAAPSASPSPTARPTSPPQ